MNAEHLVALSRAGWKSEEDSLLFEIADRARNEGKPLKSVFEEVAAATGRRPNSIRNYYYARIKANDENIRNFAPNAAFVPFTDAEIESLLRTVLSEQAKGVSVRACTLAMGNGDNKLMLRYQNKYRSLVKSNPALVKSIIQKMQMEGAEVFDPYAGQCRLRKVGRPRKQGESLVDAISGVVNDLSRVEGMDVTAFFESLGALAVGAVKGAEAMQELSAIRRSDPDSIDFSKAEAENRALRERLAALETELSMQKELYTQLTSRFRELMSINREFLSMTSVVKMSSLGNYIRDLTRSMEQCEKNLPEYVN